MNQCSELRSPFVAFATLLAELENAPGSVESKFRLGRRSLLTLTLAEREDISRGIASGWSIRVIAKHLERAASTVSREVTRHGGRPQYRANEADHQAWESALRPRRCLLAVCRIQTAAKTYALELMGAVVPVWPNLEA